MTMENEQGVATNGQRASSEAHRGTEQTAFADEHSDEDLLEQFLNAEESGSQRAFGALVERHGPMVLGICRHVLSQHQDAEDAFQATFLVLAKKGGSIRNRRVLAGWLHEVAHRIAVKARASRSGDVQSKGRVWRCRPQQ